MNSINYKILIGLILIGTCMIIACLVTIFKSKLILDDSTFFGKNHTYSVIEETHNVLSILKNIQIDRSQYQITGNEAFLNSIDRSRTTVLESIQTLKKITLDRPYQGPQVDSLAQLTQSMINSFSTAEKKGDTNRYEVNLIDSGKTYLAYAERLISSIQKVEYELLQLRDQRNQRSVTSFIYIFSFLLALFIVIIFITIRYALRTQKKTAVQQALYESVIQSTEDAIITEDMNGIISSWNRGAEKLFNYTSEEIIGKPLSILTPQHGLHEVTEIRNELKKGCAVHYHNVQRLRKDGSLIYISATISPLKNGAGTTIGASKIARDVTEYVLNEQKLVKSLKDISDYKHALDESAIVAITDHQGKIKHVNQNFCKISRYGADELIGQDHRIINSGYHSSAFIKNLWSTISNGGIWKGELRNKAKDGSIYWVDTTIVPFLNDQHKPYQYVVIRADITDRKLAEQENQSREQELRKLVKDISDYKFALDESAIVAITDQKGIIKHVNANFCKISKYFPAELVGQDHRIINSGYHSKEFIRDLWITIANGKIWKGELKNKAKDGTTYWVDTTIVPFLNDAGKPYQYVAIRSDITQRKKAEEIEQLNEELQEKIRSKSEELVEVFTRITDGFIVLDNDLRYTYVNKRTGEMVGRDPDSLLGKKVWDEFPEAINSETFHAFNRALREQRYVKNLDYYAPLNLWQENHIYPTTDGLSVFIRDVSEQKIAEEKIKQSEKIYKTIASGIPGSVICMIDIEYRYILVEGDMLERMGYSREALVGFKAIDVIPPARLTQVLPYFHRVFSGESFSVDNFSPGFDVLTRFVPLRDERNEVFAAMIVIFDVSELKTAQRALGKLNAELEDKIKERTVELQVANKELEAFTYSVAHDLRTPLRAVYGYATMLEEDYSSRLDDEGRRLIDVVGRNARKMGTLIDDLLNFSKLGRKELNKSYLNMQQVAESCLLDLKLDKDYPGNIFIDNLLPVNADPKLIRHVITNLVSNAIKYSSKNEKPVIRLSSRHEKGEIIYIVRDNGVGFDQEYAGKLFGVFQRLHSDEEFEGTGVGLAIVQRIVHRHGGRVWAESAVNQGATFYFSLPAA